MTIFTGIGGRNMISGLTLGNSVVVTLRATAGNAIVAKARQREQRGAMTATAIGCRRKMIERLA